MNGYSENMKNWTTSIYIFASGAVIEGVGLKQSTGYRYIDQLLKDGYIVVQDGNILAIEDMQ